MRWRLAMLLRRWRAMAMRIIADAQVDITVLEVGLGGRLDATNVVDAPIAAVTGVAFDHEAILGHTLAAIAAEKAGIFKRGQHAFEAGGLVFEAGAARTGVDNRVLDRRELALGAGREHREVPRVARVG